MARIRHIALIAENPGKVSEFYTSVFGMTVTQQGEGGDIWLTDGYMGFTLFPMDGTTPKGIHHFGFTLGEDERPAIYEKLVARDRLPFEATAGLPARCRTFGDDAIYDADDNRVALAVGADPAPVGNSPKIKHIALFTERPDVLADFYCDVLGMTLTGVTGRGAHWVTDGYVNFALLFKRNEEQPKGINHFGFIIDPDAKPEIYRMLDDRGIEIFQPGTKTDRPFVEDGALDIEGNRFDLTVALRKIDEEMARPKDDIELALATTA
jgi:catechol 2,3-dioxygenase-like lactoylglutathione lyase family enzyme